MAGCRRLCLCGRGYRSRPVQVLGALGVRLRRGRSARRSPTQEPDRRGPVDGPARGGAASSTTANKAVAGRYCIGGTPGRGEACVELSAIVVIIRPNPPPGLAARPGSSKGIVPWPFPFNNCEPQARLSTVLDSINQLSRSFTRLLL